MRDLIIVARIVAGYKSQCILMFYTAFPLYVFVTAALPIMLKTYNTCAKNTQHRQRLYDKEGY